MLKDINEFAQAVQSYFLECRSKIDSNLTDEKLREDINLQRSFIATSFLATEETAEAGYVIWMNENKNVEKMVDQFRVIFQETPNGLIYNIVAKNAEAQ